MEQQPTDELVACSSCSSGGGGAVAAVAWRTDRKDGFREGPLVCRLTLARGLAGEPDWGDSG